MADARTMPRLRQVNRIRKETRSVAVPIVAAFFALGLTALAVASAGDNGYGASRSVTRDVTVRPAGREFLAGASREASTDDATAEEDPYHGFCSGSGFLNSRAGLALYIPTVFVMFIGIAIVTDDYFVPALERICEDLHLSEDVAGATFMAAGSSAPELFASLLAVFVTGDDVGVGTIVGSAVFNILVIIGLSAALAGENLKLNWRPLARDTAFYIMSIVLLLLVLLTPNSRGSVTWWEGLILCVAYGCYIAFMAFLNKRWMSVKFSSRAATVEPPVAEEDGTAKVDPTPKSRWRSSIMALLALNRMRDESPEKSSIEEKPLNSTAARATNDGFSGNAVAEGSTDDSPDDDDSSDSDESVGFFHIERPSGVVGWLLSPIVVPWTLLFKVVIPDCSKDKRRRLWPATFIMSILVIGAISYAMVESARKIGCLLGIPPVVMGLTVLAAGTSVPDALASVAVARNGRGDMAVSNAIGSNVFDILLGLGFAWFLGGAIKQPIEVQVDPITLVIVPIVILFGIVVVLVGALVALKWTMRPLLGYILFGVYIAFIAYQLLDTYVFEIGRA